MACRKALGEKRASTFEEDHAVCIAILVISPYAKPDHISHYTYEFSSMLKFIEKRFGLSHLTARDDYADPMFNCFDFEQQPNPPLVIPIPANLPEAPEWAQGCAYLPYVTLPESVPDIGTYLRRYPPPEAKTSPGRVTHYVGEEKGPKKGPPGNQH